MAVTSLIQTDTTTACIFEHRIKLYQVNINKFIHCQSIIVCSQRLLQSSPTRNPLRRPIILNKLSLIVLVKAKFHYAILLANQLASWFTSWSQTWFPTCRRQVKAILTCRDSSNLVDSVMEFGLNLYTSSWFIWSEYAL